MQYSCPSLDKLIKSKLSAATKSRDREIVKQQALTLDAAGPLTIILKEAAKGHLSKKVAVEAAQTALKLLGNASAHASRRKNAIQGMNPRLIDMAEDDYLFRSSAPVLFGEGLPRKAKEMDDELKCLNQATRPTPNATTRPATFFVEATSKTINPNPMGVAKDTTGREITLLMLHT